MRVRVRFAKFGSARFLGHLDVMRYFQKVFRRAELPLMFSEGYHPHPILSFAQPLSLSYTSDGEYFDMELREELSEETIAACLTKACNPEIPANRVTILPDHKPNAKKVTGMSLITGASYAISLRQMPQNLPEVLHKFASEKSYMVEKTTKNGTRECDLRAGVHGLSILKNGVVSRIYDDGSYLFSDEDMLRGAEHASLYDDTAVIVWLDAGSERNIPADVFLQGILSYAGITEEKPERTFHRMDLFGDRDEKKVPLWMIES
ncbi:MAG: TIGR03936 family radical SAM-associated protein [Lachnospiraceae bacterium]|nr:TIGR03936 family radical SAM-associated protein [Lachnospiraceae bacterium]